MEKKHIVIVGLGGVGGYFGFKINQANEAHGHYKVTFIARGETYDVVAKNGLTLRSPEHPIDQTSPDAIHQDIHEISKADLVLVCVKEYDLKRVCTQLSEVISADTVILPMMNGVDIYERMRETLPDHVILPSCIYVASHIKQKGVVEHKGKAGKLIYGRDPVHADADVAWIEVMMVSSMIDFTFKESAALDIWSKFLFVASFGLVSAKHNSSIGAVCEAGEQQDKARAIMTEIKAIADAKGVGFPDDIIGKVLEKASTFPPATPTSLQLDVNSGKEHNELELFAGAIIKFGKDLSIDTSVTQKIYQEIKRKLGGES